MVVTVVVMTVVGSLGMSRSAVEWNAVEHVELGPYSGEAVVVGDSKSVGDARRVVLEIEGRRFETWAFGSATHQIGRLRHGDVVHAEGIRTAFTPEHRRRSQIRHIVGRFEMTDLRTTNDTRNREALIVRAANRIRDLIGRGAHGLPERRASLFSGLVYGDDSSQPGDMIADFRSSGLAHLTAVSGQNVVFVLTMAGPVLSRLRRSTRVGATLVVLVWFAIMTRIEPSVVRAVFMAGTSSVMLALGRPVSSWISLCVTTTVVVLIDPFLVWSVGWWLSVAGCVGLIVLTPVVTRSLPTLPTWMASWVAPTLAAQAGVLVVITKVFGLPSAVSIPCNLLATPVAGLVMLIGLPTAVVAGCLPDPIGNVVMKPIGVGVAWVDTVASVGARLDPAMGVDAAVAVLLIIGLALTWMVHRPSPVDGEPRVPSSPTSL